MKISFFATYDQFIKPIITELANRGHEVSFSNEYNLKHCYDAEVIWVDWADQNALRVAELVTPATKILRVHAYEAWTDIWDSINLEEFDTVIFVSEHIRGQVKRRTGKEIPNSVVIPPYIDIERYDIPEGKERNNKIAYAGYFCRKKGIGELLMLAESLPDYEFHLAGTPQEEDYDYVMENVPDNVFFYKWQDNLNEFFQDKTYVINASLREGFPVATVEAMLCGCIPIVRLWEGADTIYPLDCLWKSIDDIKRILADETITPNLVRSFMLESSGITTVMDDIDVIVSTDPEREVEWDTVTVGIIKTREKYLPQLLHSLKLQEYPIEVKVVDNIDKSKSIGQCFNILADQCDTDWIMYLGDDDYLAEGYIRDVMTAYINRKTKYRDIKGITTSTMAFDDTGKQVLTPAPSTGFWKADYIRRERFDEQLVRQVDTEFFNRKRHTSQERINVLNLSWIAGYFYRQHSDNISGNKFTTGANMTQERP